MTQRVQSPLLSSKDPDGIPYLHRPTMAGQPVDFQAMTMAWPGGQAIDVKADAVKPLLILKGSMDF